MSIAADRFQGTCSSSQRRVADVYLLGAGVSFPEHLTVETIDILSECKCICTNLPEARLVGLPDDLRVKCKSLWGLYQDGRVRTKNYQDVTDAVVRTAEEASPVAWLTPGHPLIFDSVSQALLRIGEARGWSVRAVPAISCIDTLLAEVGYDPASGLIILDCTSMAKRHTPLVPSIAAIILQPSVFGSDLAFLSSDHSGPNLTPLKEYLLSYYPSDHNCAFIRSAQTSGVESLTTWVRLADLDSIPFKTFAGSSLFLPRRDEKSSGT